MKRTVLLVQGIFLVSLAAGCAKTPGTTTATAPSPSGTAMTSPASGGAGGSRAGDSATRQGTASTSGPTTRPRIEGFKTAATGTLTDIHFEFDRYDLSPEATKILDANAEWLKANPKQLVLIEGHCDERGTGTYNIALGERRAKATQNYLAAQGIQTARMAVLSYGEERPQCAEHSENCWAKNRRAHFMVKAQ
jgi:peptidoglycan-associated lipoprotein